jgi:uncharacterized membrane protein
LSDKTPVERIYSAFFGQTFPSDLALIVVWIVASIVVLSLPLQNATLFRGVLTTPVVIFIPGYCLIAALFPKNGDLSLLERIALSFGLSMAIVPLIGLGLNFTPWGIRLDSLVISLIIFIWVMVLVAHYRRAVLPADERFSIPFSVIAGAISTGIMPKGGSRINRLLGYLLISVILIAIITTVFTIAYPRQGTQFSEFYILGEKQMASDYPDLIDSGRNYPLQIGVANHEYRNITYLIEIWAMHSEFDTMTNTSSIIAMDLLDSHVVTLSHNMTTVIPYNLSLEKTGYNRVEFLLFNETVPGPEVSGSDRINASYRDLDLWVEVR